MLVSRIDFIFIDFARWKTADALWFLSLAYSLQDERDGNQSGGSARADVSRRWAGRDFGSASRFFLVRLGFHGRMVERDGGKVEDDGNQHQKP
jgi:hypothetical protein